MIAETVEDVLIQEWGIEGLKEELLWGIIGIAITFIILPKIVEILDRINRR